MAANPLVIVVLGVMVLGIWVFVTIVRSLMNMADRLEPRPVGPRRAGGVQVGPPQRGAGVRDGRVCPYELCKAPNDIHAHFCRRCGRELAPVQQVAVRSA